jgi:hypothetical protein
MSLISNVRVHGQVALAIAIVVAVLFCACTSKPKLPTSNAAPASTTVSAASANHLDGGTYCVQTFLQGSAPAQALHFSNQIVESDPSAKSKDFQADYAGDTVDLVHRDKWLASDEDRKFFQESATFTDPKVITRSINNGIAEETVTNHATRSDEVNWRGVMTSIAQGGTPWHLFVDKPPASLVGPETVNGFDTLKYAVDTTHEDKSDKGAWLAFNHLQNYDIIGTAWVLKDSPCILQYNIDYTETAKDGKTSKTHYEGTVTKK